MSLAWLKVTPPEGEPRFRFVDAVRTLSILWILLLHVLFYCTFFVSPDASAAMVQNWPARLATRGHFGLDALFVITGFLIGYYVLVDVDRGRFSFWPWLFRRMMSEILNSPPFSTLRFGLSSLRRINHPMQNQDFLNTASLSIPGSTADFRLSNSRPVSRRISKRMARVEQCYDQLAAHRLERKSCRTPKTPSTSCCRAA